MKSKSLLFVLAVGLMGLSSAVMSSCSDNEAELVQNKPIDGISFSVTDVQNTVDAASLPKTKALSVYETQTSKITGDDAEGLELVETTIEGVSHSRNSNHIVKLPGTQQAFLYFRMQKRWSCGQLFI